MGKGVFAQFLDPRGRTDRRGLIILAAVLIGVEILLLVAADRLALSYNSLPAIAAKALLCWIAFTGTSRRLHDLGVSALWIFGALAAVFVWATIAALVVLFSLGVEALEPGAAGYLIIFVATIAPLAAAALWLHFAPGEQVENRFGPAPATLALPWHRPLAGPASGQAAGKVASQVAGQLN
jgi:uncharacterized membrane protein YhaH (DUF805 family)